MKHLFLLLSMVSFSGMVKGQVVPDTTKYYSHFPGGENGLRAFISRNIKFPSKASEDGISGFVVVDFLLTTGGMVDSISIIKSLSVECDAEVIRVIKKMPKWKPVNKEGHDISVRTQLSVYFSQDD